MFVSVSCLYCLTAFVWTHPSLFIGVSWCLDWTTRRIGIGSTPIGKVMGFMATWFACFTFLLSYFVLHNSLLVLFEFGILTLQSTSSFVSLSTLEEYFYWQAYYLKEHWVSIVDNPWSNYCPSKCQVIMSISIARTPPLATLVSAMTGIREDMYTVTNHSRISVLKWYEELWLITFLLAPRMLVPTYPPKARFGSARPSQMGRQCPLISLKKVSVPPSEAQFEFTIS